MFACLGREFSSSDLKCTYIYRYYRNKPEIGLRTFSIIDDHFLPQVLNCRFCNRKWLIYIFLYKMHKKLNYKQIIAQNLNWRQLGYIARLENSEEMRDLYKYFHLSSPADFADAKLGSLNSWTLYLWYKEFVKFTRW